MGISNQVLHLAHILGPIFHDIKYDFAHRSIPAVDGFLLGSTPDFLLIIILDIHFPWHTKDFRTIQCFDSDCSNT